MSTLTADRAADRFLRIEGDNSTRSIHLTDAEWDAVRQAAHFQDQLDEVLEDITNMSSPEDDPAVLRREVTSLQDDLFRAQLETEQWEERYDNLLRTVLGHFTDAEIRV